jgi:Flp pilus assembly protein CpaB
VEKLLAIEALESSPAKQMDVAAVALRLGAPLRRMAMTVWPQDTVQFAFLFQESMH